MNIHKTLELSTLHISAQTERYLNVLAKPTDIGINPDGVFTFDFGWFIFVQDSVDWDVPELVNIMKYAVEKDCRYIVLDCDANVCDDLPLADREDD